MNSTPIIVSMRPAKQRASQPLWIFNDNPILQATKPTTPQFPTYYCLSLAHYTKSPCG